MSHSAQQNQPQKKRPVIITHEEKLDADTDKFSTYASGGAPDLGVQYVTDIKSLTSLCCVIIFLNIFSYRITG